MAARYWVGGSADWDGTAGSKWSLTSGGAGGEAVPTAGDDVFFDGNSGAVTVTVVGSRTCNNIDFTGFTGTFAGTGAIAISGSFTAVAGMTFTHTGTLTFNATATGKTITFGGQSMGALTFNGVGGGWTFQDAYTQNGSRSITLTRGALDTNGKAITANFLNLSGGSTRSLTLGASAIALSSMQYDQTTGLTLNAGTSVITVSGTGESILGSPAVAFYEIRLTGSSVNFTQGLSCTNLKKENGGAFNYQEVLTVTGTLTLTGTATSRLLFRNLGNRQVSGKTVTAAAVALSYVDFDFVVAAGGIPWTGTSLGDCGDNSNITLATPVTRYWIGDAGDYSDTAHWSASSGGAGGASMPLPQDTAIFDANSISSGSQTVTMDVSRAGAINFSAVTNNPTFGGTGTKEFFGSVVLKAGMAVGTFTWVFNRNVSLTSAGITLTRVHIYKGLTTIQDDLTVTNELDFLYMNGASFDANDFDVSIARFVTGETNPTIGRYTLNRGFSFIYMGSGEWTLTGLDLGLNERPWWPYDVIVDGDEATIRLTGNGDKVFRGMGNSYRKLVIVGTGSTFIFDSNTFYEIEIPTPVRTLNFEAGTTTTITVFDVSGTAGNLNVIGSHNGVSSDAWYIQTNSPVISLDYVNLSDSVAINENRFFAGANSTDGGDNVNWRFTAPPAAGYDSGFFAFMR